MEVVSVDVVTNMTHNMYMGLNFSGGNSIGTLVYLIPLKFLKTLPK